MQPRFREEQSCLEIKCLPLEQNWSDFWTPNSVFIFKRSDNSVRNPFLVSLEVSYNQIHLVPCSLVKQKKWKVKAKTPRTTLLKDESIAMILLTRWTWRVWWYIGNRAGMGVLTKYLLENRLPLM
jgi:hypothetical protein